uniref:Uncharacterized protein n=1 Tax=Anopheles atroparvus TaxID=41427 RepID=A0AAG5D3C5_ANOAO
MHFCFQSSDVLVRQVQGIGACRANDSTISMWFKVCIHYSGCDRAVLLGAILDFLFTTSTVKITPVYGGQWYVVACMNVVSFFVEMICGPQQTNCPPSRYRITGIQKFPLQPIQRIYTSGNQTTQT